MALKKNNISSNKPNQRDENLVHHKLQNTVKKMKGNTNKWKGIPCSWVEKLNIVKRPRIVQNNLQLHCRPYQNSCDIFYRNRKSNSKIHMNQKELQVTKSVSKVFAVM